MNTQNNAWARFYNLPITFTDSAEPGCPAGPVKIIKGPDDPIKAAEAIEKDRRFIEKRRQSCQMGARNRARYLREREVFSERN